MNLIALDLGTKLGVAWGGTKSELVPAHAVKNYTTTSGFNGESFYKFFDDLNTMVKQALNFGTANLTIVCERPSSLPYWHTLRIHMGMYGIVEMMEGRYKGRVSVANVAPTTIKKFWTGTGKADKEFMVDQTNLLYPDVTDDNESDAIALWHYWVEEVMNHDSVSTKNT